MKERRQSQSSKMSVVYRLCIFTFSFNTIFLCGNTNAEPTPPSKWQPYIDIQAKVGNERSLGRASLFLPLTQGNNRLFFADARFVLDDSSAHEGNLGLAYRYRFGDLVHGGILGVYGFFDYRKSENDFGYKQLTGGMEWLANDWEVRANVYAPEDNKNSVSSSTSSDVALNGTTAVYRVSALSFMEQALPGYDVEAGYRFGLNDRADVWVHGGYFNFDDAGVPEVSGPRLRLEYRLRDPFGWKGSELGLGLEGQDDDVRGSQGFATARLRIPLGKVNKDSLVLSGLDRRMINPIQRDIDVVTAVDDTPVEDVVSETPIIDPGSGEVINVYFVEESGTGNCTQANPCLVGTAQGDAVYGSADIIVPLASSGVISSDIVLTQLRQQVVGGGNAGNTVLLLSSGDRLAISELGARPTLGGTLSMTNSSFAAGFDISHGNAVAAISANNITNATVRDINVLGSGGAGFDFTNVGGSITIENSSVTNAVGAGLRINGGDATYALNNLDISDTASGRSVDIQNTSGGVINFDSASSISNSGGSGLLINNVGGDVTFNAAVNVTGATSDAITLTNNSGATINFNGGLNIAAVAGTAFTATGGGTVNVVNIGTESITQDGGVNALMMDGVTIGTSGVSFDSITSTTATSGTSIAINNVNGGDFSGGNVTLVGTTVGGAGDGINVSNSAANFSFGNVVIDNTDDEGISLSGANGNVNFANVDIDGTTGRGIEVINANNAVSVSGGSIGSSTTTQGFAVRIEDQVAGSVIDFDSVDITSVNADTLSLVNADGTVNFSGGTLTQTGGNDTVDIDGGAGSVNITSTLVHTGSGGVANAVELDGTSGDITITGNVTNTGGGRLIDIGAVSNIVAGSIQLSGVLTDTNSDGVRIQNIDAGADVTVAGPAVVNASGVGIEIGANAGTVAFTGTTTVSGSGGTSIDLSAASGTISFGDVDITNLGGVTGVSTTGSSSAITMVSLDITGTGAANSTAVDITGSTGSFTVSNAGTIQNVVTGFELDSLGTGTTNSTLSYQNGIIDGGVPVNTVGITNGTYDFTGSTIINDNALSTATGFGGDFWFADATGGGTGTSTDRASIDFIETNSSNSDIILLVNDGTGNILATNGLQLKNDQQLLGFAAGDATVDFTGSNANVLGIFTYLISDPTGNGAATLSNSGGTEVVTLANNTKLRDFDLTTTGAVDGISGSGFSNTTITNLAITNAGAEAFDFTNATGTISVTDSSATNSTGAGLRLNGGNATVALNNFDISDSGSGRSLDISATTGGSVAFDANSTISNSGGTGVFINNIGGDVTFNGAVSVTSATATSLTVTNLNTNAVAFNGGLGTVSTTAGTAITASGGTLNIAGTTSITATAAQALALSNLTVGDGSGGALSFDNILSGGGANGIALSNVTATNGLTITNATLTNNTTAGININSVSGSMNITAANIDIAAAGTGVAIAGTNDTINIGTGGTGLDIDGGTTGVSINQTAGTVNLGTGASGVFAVDGTSGVGVTLAGAGTVNIGTGGGSASIGATTDTGGNAFAVTGGSVNANYAGSIALASNTGLVSVQGGHSGSLSFSGALSNSAATNATQLNFNNADGTYNFDGTVSVDTSAGTGIGLDITATSGGTIDFENSLTIATASGNAIQMDGTGSLDVSGGSLDVDTTSGTGLSQSAGTVALSDTTSIRASSTGTGINASGGTLVVASGVGTAEVISTSGQGLLLSGVTTGTGGVNFDTVNAGGGANGIALINMTATNGLTITNATLANNTTAGLNINGVSGTLNIAAANVDAGAAGTGVAIAGANGTINIGTGGPGLDIDGGTTGVSINQTSGTVNLGTGASGVFAVDGSSGAGVTLAGAGTVNIGTGGGSSSIGATTDTGGVAFQATGGSVNANYAGSIALASNTGLVSVQGGHSGSLTFSGALSNSAATTATQLNFNNADGTYNFDGTVSVDTSAGTGVGIDVAATSGGTIDFDNDLTFATASGNAIQMDGTGSLDVSGGSLDVDTTSGTGLSQSAGSVAFSDTTSIRAATTGTGINASGGTLAVASGVGTAEVISTSGQGLLLSGVTTGTGGVIFDTVNAGGGANGIALTNVTAANGLTITNAALANNTTAGLNINGVTGTLNIAAANVDTGAAGTGVAIAGANGTVNIGTGGTGLDIDGGTTGISINQTSGSVNLGTGGTGVFAVDGSSGAGVTLAGAGTVNIGTGGGSASIGTTASFGGAAFQVNGGSVNSNYAGDITQTNNTALLDVSGGHSGTLTLNTGTLSASNGSGLQFNNADGSYSFNGTTTLNGGDAGIDIINGSDGDFSFGTDASITNPSGTAFNVDGGNGTIAYSGTIANNAGRSAIIQNRSGGSVTLAGNISDTGSGLLVQNNSGGSVNFTGLSNVFVTGANTAVTLANNTGATVNFSGGGLFIATTSGSGFNASGGGTVNVTGANNIITTSTGTALNVANTSIGASGIIFHSISANGAVNGIVLNNTGASGGLSITGDGATSSSGGIIQNTTGVGISMTNTSDVNLNYLNITNTAAAGISGSGVSGGFALQNSTIQNTVGHNIGLSNVTGAINISNNTLLDANEDGGGDLLDENNGIDIANTSGTITSLTVANNTIQGTTGTTSDVGVALHLDGTAVLSTATISQNTIQGHDFHAVRLSLDNDDSGDAPVVSGMDIINNVVLSSQATAVELNARGTSDLNFTASNNAQISSDFGNGIQVNAGLFAVGGNSTATLSGSILNNTINTVGDGANDRGIDILTQESTAAVVDIDGNNISDVTNGGIALRVRDTSSLDAVVNNNTLTNTDTFGGGVLGLFAETRETSSGCFAITNNNNALTYQLNQSVGTVFNLEPLVGNTGTINTSGTITAVAGGTCQRVP